MRGCMSVKNSTLSDAVSSLRTPDQFNQLLDQSVTLSVSWQGKRMMHVKGYTGEIEVHTLIRQFLGRAPIPEEVSKSLKGRLDWYDLWESVRRIYQKSDEELQKTWAYKYYVPTLEGRVASGLGDSIALLECDSVQRDFLCFNRIDFTKIWPDRAAELHDDFWDKTGKAYVSRDLLAEACRSQTSIPYL